MQQELSSNLKQIYDLELTLGNQAQVHESSHAAFPLVVVFKEPLHRTEIESKIQIVPPVKWYSSEDTAGYISEDTRQSLQAPIGAVDEVARVAMQKFSTNLRAIYDLELSLGNTVKWVNELVESPCSLYIVFKKPLHKDEVEATLSLSPFVKWFESHDPHWPIEGGYQCEETSHVIAGPLRYQPGSTRGYPQTW